MKYRKHQKTAADPRYEVGTITRRKQPYERGDGNWGLFLMVCTPACPVTTAMCILPLPNHEVHVPTLTPSVPDEPIFAAAGTEYVIDDTSGLLDLLPKER